MDNNEKVEEQLNTESTVNNNQGELPVINPLSDSLDSTGNDVQSQVTTEATIDDINTNQGGLPIVDPLSDNGNSTTNDSSNSQESSQPENQTQTEKIEIVEATESNIVPRTDMEADQSNVVISNSINENNNSNLDNTTMINENLKKVEVNYTPPSKAKVVLLVLFFIFLIGFVLFLPDITSYIGKYKAGELNTTEEVITSGVLKCSLSTSTTNLDKNYDLDFYFTDSKLQKTSFSITTKGDATLDEETLDEYAATCKQLKENVEGMQGVIIQCDYTEGKLVETQTFDLAVIDSKELGAAFTEAGGNNPEYQYEQDIDRIERNMNASNYTCKRESR